MKKIYILLIALFAIYTADAQWFRQNSGTTNNLNSVYFPSTETGYVVGEDGCILKTTNGGTKWTELVSPTIEYLTSTFFINADTGYILSSAGEIHRTNDGGLSWTDVYDINCHPEMGAWCHYESLVFTNELNGYFIGWSKYYAFGWHDNGYIYKTSDCGVSWSHDTFNNFYLYSISFPDDSTGFAVGGDSILKTTDGGLNWLTMASPLYFTSVCFTNAYTGYAVGERKIVKTSDGGSNWILQYYCPDPENGFTSVYFIDENNGYVLTYYADTILYTNDGGTNWVTQVTQDAGSNSPLNSICFTSADTGYIVGSYGIILKTINGGIPVGISEKPLYNETLSIHPNPTTGLINLEIPYTSANSQLTILNLSGQKIMEITLTGPRTRLDISALPRGVYFVRLQNEKTVQVGKFVKQ